MSCKFKYNLETNEPFVFDYDTGELCCVLCKNAYGVYNDPFTVVIDANSFIEITYELCLNCIRSFKKCYECNRVMDEPWDKIYFNMTDKNRFYCSCCYKDERNKNYKKCGLMNCIVCSKKHLSLV